MDYRILIAEDEELTRKAVRSSLETLLPSAVFTEVENGRQAVDASCAASILHMAFLDVKMPQLDGIQAAQQIHAAHQNCQIIFLTAYSDFAYMKEALDIGATDYLLKPFSQVALAIALQKAVGRLDLYENSRDTDEQYRLQIEQLHQQVSSQTLQNILSGQQSPTVLGLQLRRSGMAFQRGAFAILRCPQTALTKRIGGMVRGGNWTRDCKLFLLEQNNYIFVLAVSSLSKPLAPDLATRLLELCTLASDLHGYVLSCAVGGDFTLLEQAEIACLHCYSLLRSCIEQEPFQRAADEVQFSGLSDLLLAQTDDAALCDKIQDFLELQTLLEIRPELTGNRLYYALVHLLQLRNPSANLTELRDRLGPLLLDCRSSAELNTCLAEIRRFFSIPIGSENGHSDSVGQRAAILAYLEQHYADPITLETLSAHLQYSPTYVSKLFKRLFGQNFVSCLTELRLRHAQVLLAQSDVSIKDISVRAGFGTAAYFTSIFRRETGLTPSQFRSQKREEPK